MFEREIKFIYDFNVNLVKKLGTSFNFESLANINLHPAILNYISAEIDYLIYEDRKRLIENSNFDYSGEQVNKYFSLINKEIKKEKKLSVDYINQLILHAVSFTANFLAQPNWALTKLIFAKEDSVNIQEANQILDYLFYYNHLRELLEKLFIKKHIVTLERSEFEALLEKIYSQLFSEYKEAIIQNVLSSMADFYNFGSVHKEKIPHSAFELFLKEKKLDDYLERLNDAFPEETRQNFDVTEIKNILFSPVPIKRENYLDRAVKQEEPANVFPEEINEEIREEAVEELTESSVAENSVNEEQQRQDDEDVNTLNKLFQPEEGISEEAQDTDTLQPSNKQIDKLEIEATPLILNSEEIPVFMEEIVDNISVETSEDIESARIISDASEEPLISFAEEKSIELSENNSEMEESETDTVAESEKTEESITEYPSLESDDNDKIETDLVEEIELKPVYNDEDFLIIGEEGADENEILQSEDTEGFIIKEVNGEKILEEIVAPGKTTEQEELKDIEDELKEEIANDYTQNEIIKEIDQEAIAPEKESIDNEIASEKESEGTETIAEVDKSGPIEDTEESENQIQLEEDEEEPYVLPEKRKEKFEKDISYFFKGKKIDKIISVVFDDDVKDFAQTFDNLAQCNDQDEAISILNTLFLSKHVKPTSKEVAQLIEIVNEYFSQK